MIRRVHAAAMPASLLLGLIAVTAAGAQAPSPSDTAPTEMPAVENALPAPVEAPPPAAPAPSAPAAVSSRIGPPPAGKGQVVVFRRSSFVGMALTFSVREGDKGVVKVGNGSYGVIVADPGPHAYSMEGEVTDTLNIEVDEGETYYVEHAIGAGVVMARPNLTPSTQEAFDRLPKLKLSTATPTDKKPREAK